MDAFVHASGDGFGNTAPLRSDTGAIDMDAISQVAHVTQGAGKLTRKEKKHAKREMKRRKKEAKKAEKEAKKTYSSIKSQLKDRDKELSDKMADARKKRDSAKDVVNYIGYNKMYQDGICEVEEGMFSSSIAFDDTSYHSVRDEQQKAMFSAITRLYDQFGADTLVQMSVINTPLLKEEVGHRKFFDPERQANDAARNDAQVFNNILNDKVKEGVSNIRRNRYLTYSVTADTAEDAARQLSRIEVESSRILNSIGSKAHLMNGTQRLSVIHSLLNPYKPFLFDYQRDISAKRLQTTKDCIAPTQIDFRPDGHYNDCVKLDNGVYAQVLVMKKFGSELSDRALADMADLPIPMAITWYVQPMDKSKAINYVRTRSAWIDKEIIEEQRSAVNKGYDFSILPQELKYSKEETEDVLDHLQNKNQRLYVFTGLVYTYAESKEALDTQVLRIISTARQNSIELDTYDYRQRQGLNSILPLGHNHVEISRMFTTAQISILVPFATQELDDAGGNFYGQNKYFHRNVYENAAAQAGKKKALTILSGGIKGMLSSLAGAVSQFFPLIIAFILAFGLISVVGGGAADEEQKSASLDGMPAWVTYDLVLACLNAHEQYGYPASALLGQMMIENGTSDSGSDLGRLYHNYGGVKYAGYDYGGLITGSVKMLTTEYSASGSAYKTYADFAVFKDDDSYMKYRCEHLYKQSNYTRVPNYQKAIDTNNSELFLRALGEGGYYTASQDSYIAQYRSICQAYPLVAQLDSMTAEEFKNRYSGTTLIPGGGQDYQSADQWQKDIVNACSQTPWPGANLCATWTTRVYARAGHPVGGNGNTQLGNQGYGANYSQKRATTDLSQIKVGMLISAQYGSNTPAGNAYGHVGIYIGDGKVMDSIYSGLRTISLSDWVSQNGRGWVVCGYPWDWR